MGSLSERRYILLGFLTIGILLLSLIGWASLVKIDTYVIAYGKVIAEGDKKPVQYSDLAVVRKIFVKEGDKVKKGDPLLEVENIQKQSNYEVLKRQYYELIAIRDRLLAEREHAKEIKFSKEILSMKEKNLKEKIVSVQKEVFKKRREEFNKKLELIDEKIRRVDEQIKGLSEILVLKKSLLDFYNEQVEIYKDLLNSGLISRTKVDELEIRRKELLTDIADIETKLVQLSKERVELVRQRELIFSEYNRTVTEELQRVLYQLEEVKTKLKYAKKEVKRTVIKAPSSGQVIGITVKAEGEVVQPGQILMYIVPEKENLIIVGKVFPEDRDKVFEGMLVDIRFPSFVNLAANFVEGKVVYISSDTLVDEKLKTEYYEVHIVLTEKGEKQLKEYNFELVPGMPAIAFIKVEKITPIEYVLSPIFMLVKASFKSN